MASSDNSLGAINLPERYFILILTWQTPCTAWHHGERIIPSLFARWKYPPWVRERIALRLPQWRGPGLPYLVFGQPGLKYGHNVAMARLMALSLSPLMREDFGLTMWDTAKSLSRLKLRYVLTRSHSVLWQRPILPVTFHLPHSLFCS